MSEWKVDLVRAEDDMYSLIQTLDLQAAVKRELAPFIVSRAS